MSKKAQITVFIIIGILVLFAFAGILYFTKSTVKEKITKENEPVIAPVPQEFVSLKSFTENCLQSLGKKGLLSLGQQGGYIYPDLLGEFSVNDPTNSVGINLGVSKVPYWFYNSEPNKGSKITYHFSTPKLHYQDDPVLSIEAQLMRFINEGLDPCLDNYSAFTKQGFEISSGTKETEVKVGDNSVNFLLNMPLKVKKGSTKGDINQFYVKIPLNLKHYYEVAEKINNAEKDFHFLETHSLNLISAFSGTEMDKLPPTSATTLELAPHAFWNEVEVKEKARRVLTSYIPMLKFLGSANFYDYVYPDSQLSGLYQAANDQAVLNLRGAEELNVNFDYFNWPIYLATNSANGMIKPFNLFVSFGPLMMSEQTYETHYDLSFPVLVTLRDDSAFDGQGYDFIFALEGNIRNNEVAPEGKAEEGYPKQASRLSCDKELWETGNLRTVVVDSFTKKPVELVKIGFTLPDQDACEVGFTDNKGKVESKYPAAYGGVVNFIKLDYLTNFYPIDTYNYRKKTGLIGYAALAGYPEKVVEMHHLKTINVSAKKINLEKCIGYPANFNSLGAFLSFNAVAATATLATASGSKTECFYSGLFNSGEKIYSFKPELSDSNHTWILSNVVKPLKTSEQAFITLNRISDLNEGVFNSDFSRVITVSGEEKQAIQLVPGIYEVSSSLILNEEVIIPKEERCTGGVMEALACWDTKGCCFTFNETKMEKFMSGQLSWNTPKSYLKITPEDLYTSKEIVFYLPNQNILNVPQEAHKRVTEDLQVIGVLSNLSQSSPLKESLKPKFI